METRKILVLAGCVFLILLIGVACKGEAQPEGSLTVYELLENPVYDTEIKVFGQVSLLGDLFCPCFVLSSGGKSVEVWYSMMTEEDGTPWPSVSVDGFQSGDFVIVTGELKMDVKSVVWAVVIDKAE